jgi:hypothetical protein
VLFDKIFAGLGGTWSREMEGGYGTKLKRSMDDKGLSECLVTDGEVSCRMENE